MEKDICMERNHIIITLIDFLRKATFNSTLDARPDAHLQNDLGVDSMGAVEFANMIEDEYKIEINEEEMNMISTLNQAADLIIAKTNKN